MKYQLLLLVGAASAIRMNLQAQADLEMEQKWVELPDCKTPKGADEIALNDDLKNAAIATCKIRKPKLDPDVVYCDGTEKAQYKAALKAQKEALEAAKNASNGTNGTNGTNATNGTNGTNGTNATNATITMKVCVSKPIEV